MFILFHWKTGNCINYELQILDAFYVFKIVYVTDVSNYYFLLQKLSLNY